MAYTISEELRSFVEEGMKRNPFAVLSRLIGDGVYREIIEGRLTVNDYINVSHLAEGLGVSRTPINIAMNDLLEQGMLEKRNGNKLSVKRMTMEECSLLYETRISLETEAAYLAARRITEEELRQMRHLLEEFREIDQTADQMRFVHCDKAFHDLVLRAAKNRILEGAYKYIEGFLQRYRFQTTLLDYQEMCHRNGISDELDYHFCIYEALKRHLPIEAKDAIFRDVERMHGTMYLAVKNATEIKH